MNLVPHLARFIPSDAEVLALEEDAVLAALEAFGLVTRLQRGWDPRHGVVPPVKKGKQAKQLRGSVWARRDELTSYLEMALEEGRARGHTWRELVPAIAARIPPAGHAMVLFVLCACALDPTSETLEQAYLIDAFAEALGEDRDACLAAVIEHYRDHFDYERALAGLLDAAIDFDAPGARAELLALLERLGMGVPGTRGLDAEELERLPDTTLLAVCDDASLSAAVYLVPRPIIAPTIGPALGGGRSLCFAGPDDLASDEAWLAVVRLLAALGEAIHDDHLAPYADHPACPGAEELAALEGAWSQYFCVAFEDGSTAEGRRVKRGGYNVRLCDLVLINRAM